MSGEVKIIKKCDISNRFNMSNRKALNFLRFMFQTGYGNKIGREYYTTESYLNDFLEFYKGK